MKWTTPKLPEHHLQWFQELKKAADNGDLALMSCLDAKANEAGDHEPRSVICILTQEPDGSFKAIPLGHMATTENPYDAYIPPEDSIPPPSERH